MMMDRAPASPLTYVCDTLPAARSVTGSSFELAIQMSNHDMEHLDVLDSAKEPQTQTETSALSRPKATKLCVRHRRMADEGTNLMLQQVS